MLNYLRQLRADEKNVSFDVYLLSGLSLLGADIEEVDSVGLLTLSEGCRRMVPWTSISHICVNEERNEDSREN